MRVFAGEVVNKGNNYLLLVEVQTCIATMVISVLVPQEEEISLKDTDTLLLTVYRNGPLSYHKVVQL